MQLISELHNPGETKAHDKNNTTANQKLSLEETKSKLSERIAFGEVAIQLTTHKTMLTEGERQAIQANQLGGGVQLEAMGTT